jgi:neutral ceramidase
VPLAFYGTRRVLAAHKLVKFCRERPLWRSELNVSNTNLSRNATEGVPYRISAMIRTFIGLSFSAVCLAFGGGAPAAEFKAGVGRAVITPTAPMWMSGFAARKHPSDGVVHDLWAKALVLEDQGGRRVAIVTMDLIGLPREVADAVAERVRKQHGIERPQLVLNASHTHSGPAIWPNLKVMFDLGPEDQKRTTAYAEKLIGTLADLVGAAVADLAPAEITSGHGSADFAVNRREPTEKGMRIGVNPEGPVDRDVPVVRISSPDGKLRAVLFGYACHNTTLGANSYKICGDYSGFAQIELEKAHPGAAAMFLALCGADQNTHPRGTMELAARYGQALASAVDQVLGGAMRPVQGPIHTAWQTANLEFAPHDRATFEKETASKDSYRRRRAKLMLEAYAAGHPVRQLSYPVQAVRFNDDLLLVALSGEVVVDYALRLKREFPQENLVVAGYTNEVQCYIPSVQVLRGGGYEPVESMIYYGLPGPFAENVEEAVIAACRRCIAETAK